MKFLNIFSLLIGITLISQAQIRGDFSRNLGTSTGGGVSLQSLGIITPIYEKEIRVCDKTLPALNLTHVSIDEASFAFDGKQAYFFGQLNGDSFEETRIELHTSNFGLDLKGKKGCSSLKSKDAKQIIACVVYTEERDPHLSVEICEKRKLANVPYWKCGEVFHKRYVAPSFGGGVSARN